MVFADDGCDDTAERIVLPDSVTSDPRWRALWRELPAPVPEEEAQVAERHDGRLTLSDEEKQALREAYRYIGRICERLRAEGRLEPMRPEDDEIE